MKWCVWSGYAWCKYQWQRVGELLEFQLLECGHLLCDMPVLLCSSAVLDASVGHTAYLCLLSFWLSLPQGVFSMSWCYPSRPYLVFFACMCEVCEVWVCGSWDVQMDCCTDTLIAILCIPPWGLCPSNVTHAFACELLSDDEELASLQQSLASDILSAPVPSNLPSPALMPLTQRPPSSLIRFDSLASIQGAMSCIFLVGKGYLVTLCNRREWYQPGSKVGLQLTPYTTLEWLARWTGSADLLMGLSVGPRLTSWWTYYRVRHSFTMYPENTWHCGIDISRLFLALVVSVYFF